MPKEAFSSQSLISLQQIRKGAIILKNGSLRSVLEVSGINLDLKSEEELRKIDELLRGEDEEIWKQEQAIKQKKLEIFRAYDELNTEKLRSMGFDKNQSIIRCVVCREWKSFDKDKLSELIKKNDIDIIWKYVCNECRKKLKLRKRVSVKYDPGKFIGSE